MANTELKQLFELVTCNSSGASNIQRQINNSLLKHYFSMFTKFKTFSVLLFLPFLLVEADTLESTYNTDRESAETITVNLDYVLERVRAYNPQVLFQKEAVVRALERSYQQRAALLPQFDIFASQNRQQLGRGFGGGALGNNPPFNSFSAGIEGRQSLINTDVYANFRIAKLERLIAESNFEVALQDILEQSVLSYFTVLRDLRRVEIVQGNIVREMDLLALAKDQFANGVATKIDVTRAEVRVATQKRSLMVAKTTLEDSMFQMMILLDLNLDTELLIDREIISDVKSPPALLRYASMEILLENRPELFSQQKQLEQAELAESAASWQRLPQLNVFGRWGYDSGTPFDGAEENAWLVGIEASIPLFEGGRIAAEKREAKAAVRQNTYLMRQLSLSIEREFKFAITDMESRYQQISIASDEMRLGFDEVELATERYREGLADNRELIDAQQNLANAELSHLNAIYLYGVSRLAFARSIGAVERVAE